jgi:NADH-quinone oxidoreductase subunit L
MNLLPLTFILPLAGYLLSAFAQNRLSENQAAAIGVGSIGLAFASAIYTCVKFLGQPAGFTHEILLWNWMAAGTYQAPFTLYLDGLSLTMLGVITGVGFLIHLFASWYMRGEEGYGRFFAYMNLFVCSMVILVLGNNLVLLFLGWEGVGLCSYLLIGFIYQKSENGYAARKSFIITRVGDVFLLIGLFLLFHAFGTLNIQDILNRAPEVWATGNPACRWACLLLLLGAVGKSAQLPLQTWLPDAMAGPTPVSALIHAATMVTAGVYLIARMHTLYSLAPDMQLLVGMVGAATLLLASCSALVQTDIKRVLAYSTMSQIGYMFLALGVGAWSAAIFHLMIHAFFKALLFLASGAVIVACHHEQDMFKMGGLWKKLPWSYVSFWVGGAALAALPVITAGYYSKDAILWQTLASDHQGLLIAGLVGAFLTPIYTFRMIFLTFHGEAKTKAHPGHGVSFWLPLGVLTVLSTFIGALIHPPLSHVLPAGPGDAVENGKHLLEAISGSLAIIGLALAAFLYLGGRRLITTIANLAPMRLVRSWWFHAWAFDWLYNMLFCYPYMFLSRVNRNDVVNTIAGIVPGTSRFSNGVMSRMVNGRLRWYAGSIALGAAIVMIAMLLV